MESGRRSLLFLLAALLVPVCLGAANAPLNPSRQAFFSTPVPQPSFQSNASGGSPTATPSPTISMTSTVTPTPTQVFSSAFTTFKGLTTTAPADFTAEPPDAPANLSVEFSLRSASDSAGDSVAKPAALLSWQAAFAHSYILKGYRLLRKVAGNPATDFTVVQGAAAPLAVTVASESVEIGHVYEFAVQAVDAKGNSSALSQRVKLDLISIDPARLAPRAPLNLTATSQRNAVKLSWDRAQPGIDEIASYTLLRNSLPLKEGLTLTAYLDLSPTTKTIFSYQVLALDKAARKSLLSLSATGQATGTLPPGAPRNLTISAKTEKIVLSWDSSLAGTAPVSQYLFSRVTEPGHGETESTEKKFRPLDLSRTSYTDSVEGSHFYSYELRAVDSEGNTSAPATIRAWVESKPFNKTAILLMPTAYSNNSGHDTGVNANVLFDYFVGSLFYNFTSETTQQTKSGVFQPLQVGSITTDLKATWVEETWLTPALATGFYGAALINFGSQNTAQTVGVSSAGSSITTLGDIYVVASKRFGFQSAVHLGAMRGHLADDLVGLAAKSGHPDWEMTIRHLTPSRDYPELLNHFVDPGLSVQMQNSPHMLFGGIQFPVTVPLGFTRWKTGLKAELLMPIDPEQLNRNTGITDVSPPPVMINFHIDNLPLFGFEFSIFEFKNGWEWIAFYHVPDLTWSW